MPSSYLHDDEEDLYTTTTTTDTTDDDEEIYTDSEDDYFSDDLDPIEEATTFNSKKPHRQKFDNQSKRLASILRCIA